MAQSKKALNAKPAESEITSATGTKSYYYSNFRKGSVTFITGIANPGILNYDVLNDEVAYITAKRDTLTLDDLNLIEMLTIEQDTFYYDAGSSNLLKLLETVNGRKLLITERHAPTKGNNLTAADMAKSNTAKSYYVSNKAGFLPATTANFLKLYPAHSTQLSQYIKENNLELKSEDEIKKLLQYASSL